MIKTITPWICKKCAWHNSEEDELCRNKTCDNSKRFNYFADTSTQKVN